jgi:major membrane immunogen (membrane-anchored lipoprotein)
VWSDVKKNRADWEKSIKGAKVLDCSAIWAGGGGSLKSRIMNYEFKDIWKETDSTAKHFTELSKRTMKTCVIILKAGPSENRYNGQPLEPDIR